MFDTKNERAAMEEVLTRFNDEMKKVRTGAGTSRYASEYQGGSIRAIHAA